MLGSQRICGGIAALLMSGVVPARSPVSLPTCNGAECSITQLQEKFSRGSLTSVALTQAYLTRITRLNPRLHAVISVNSHAVADAAQSDFRRAQGRSRGALDGIPILLKDNIDLQGLATTAGSLALIDNRPRGSAPLVMRLQNAGAVILGKTNLSEWANIRSDYSSSGWSAVGGLTRNPYVLDRSACGSSAGSATALSAGLAAAAIGTETDGSIICPASIGGVVGLKPTVGLVSRTGVIPISHSQDTAGPMALNVADAAALLSAMAGSDAADVMTATADAQRRDYGAALNPLALRGARLGVMRFMQKHFSPQTWAVFEAALSLLRAQGATLVDIDDFDFADMGKQELTVLLYELKVDLNRYLAGTPDSVATRNLDELIAFDRREPLEMPWFGQELFEQAASTSGLEAAEYQQAARAIKLQAGVQGIDRLLRESDLVALLAPSTGPAWSIDLVNGDASSGSASRLPAVAGYPHLTVPMGQVAGLPVGLSFIGPAWSEARLLSLGYAYEMSSHARRQPHLLPTLNVDPSRRRLAPR